MQHNFAARVDFNIDKALQNLAELQASLPMADGRQSRSLLTRQADGSLQVLPLGEAKALIDHIWDHAFQYADGTAK